MTACATKKIDSVRGDIRVRGTGPHPTFLQRSSALGVTGHTVFAHRLSVEVDGDIRDRSALVVDFGPAFYENKCNCAKKNGGRHEQQWFNPFWRVGCPVIHKRKLFSCKADLPDQQTQYMPIGLKKSLIAHNQKSKRFCKVWPRNISWFLTVFIEGYSAPIAGYPSFSTPGLCFLRSHTARGGFLSCS